MTRRWIWIFMSATIFLELTGSYLLFDSYVERTAQDLINTVLKSEAASIQQGNLLSSISKLEASLATSESLRGVALFDRSLDPSLQFPLIKLGMLPFADADLTQNSGQRVGLFDRIYVRKVTADKSIFFYFKPDFVFFSYTISSIFLISFSIVIAVLGQRAEAIRSRERRDVLTSIWQQISHDIRSPIGAIRIFSTVASRSGLSTGLVDNAINRVEEILDDLKARSEIAETERRFRADQALREVVAEKISEFPSYQIRLVGEAVCEIVGNQSHFKRMISNILNNSIEASPPDRPIEVHLENFGNRIKLRFVDQGSGIPVDIQREVFKRGFTSGKANGTGLGLYHASKITRAMGGELLLKSEINKGTEIAIELNAI